MLTRMLSWPRRSASWYSSSPPASTSVSPTEVSPAAWNISSAIARPRRRSARLVAGMAANTRSMARS